MIWSPIWSWEGDVDASKISNFLWILLSPWIVSTVYWTCWIVWFPICSSNRIKLSSTIYESVYPRKHYGGNINGLDLDWDRQALAWPNGHWLVFGPWSKIPLYIICFLWGLEELARSHLLQVAPRPLRYCKILYFEIKSKRLQCTLHFFITGPPIPTVWSSQGTTQTSM